MNTLRFTSVALHFSILHLFRAHPLSHLLSHPPALRCTRLLISPYDFLDHFSNIDFGDELSSIFARDERLEHLNCRDLLRFRSVLFCLFSLLSASPSIFPDFNLFCYSAVLFGRPAACPLRRIKVSDILFRLRGL